MTNNMNADLDLKRMAALAIEIERLRHEFQPMPDDIMDFLTEARWTLTETVLAMPATEMSDLSAKLSMIAATNRDDASFDPALPRMLSQVQAEVEALRIAQFSSVA
ncbi:MAG: hypothetical protein ACOH2J_19970 [Allorhizobium sp.]